MRKIDNNTIFAGATCVIMVMVWLFVTTWRGNNEIREDAAKFTTATITTRGPPPPYYKLHTCAGPNQALCMKVAKFMNEEPPYLEKKSELTKIMDDCGSNKGSVAQEYTALYDFIFQDFRYKTNLTVLEVGIGTKNPNMPSHMAFYKSIPGGSHRGWRTYFPNSQIYGGDIDKDVVFNEDRIRTCYVDQLKPDAIRDMFSLFGENTTYDIMLDDGLHTFEANTCLMDNSIKQQHLKKGGYYIIEDIHTAHMELYEKHGTKMGYYYAMIHVPNSQEDRYITNTLFIVEG